MSSRYSREPNDCKIYVGDLQKDASEKEIEREFSYYGRLKSVWVARNPPGFAFVEFEDYRDAEDAVKELDGQSICGGRIRVEPSSGKVRPKPWARGGRGPSRSRRAFNPDDRCYECGGRGHYAYDCSNKGKRSYGGGGGDSRSSRRRSRSYSRSHSRSRSRGRRDSYSKSRSRSPYYYRRFRSPLPRRSRSRSAVSRHSN